ncbi:hypothetical protein FQN57_007115 [Myotisia sp. PD_48]|nr:hypothetical protein FQN57_007115 [Myotisia sp. PD_48]
MSPPHILIIGAGITGLTLAQALRKAGIPFTVFERDPTPLYRGKGWGLTLHWALDTLLSLLPQDLIDRLPETYVNPVAVENEEPSKFLFFDLSTSEIKWQVQPMRRARVSREKFRRLLMDGIDIQWNKTISGIEQTPDCTNIRCHFTDGTSAEGGMLLGCDGARSKTRSLLCSLATSPGPDKLSENYQLPVRLLGVSVAYKSQLALKMRALDPYFLQGGDPNSNSFFWFSFLDTPTNNDREDRDTYECQILVSWPYSPDNPGAGEVPVDNNERLKLMRSLVDKWAEPFREIVQSIPDGVEAKSISLEDWPTPPRGTWNNFDGKATLIGDAAHAMTMFRGEAGNHGIADVAKFLNLMLPVWKDSTTDGGKDATNTMTQKLACDAYEDEMISRANPAVLRSRKACLNAHDYASIHANSPLLTTRKILVDDAEGKK